MSGRAPTELDHMATWAFEAHAAMVATEASKPELSRNPYWQVLRDSAFARFRITFDRAGAQ